jgi:hypothetical protein
MLRTLARLGRPTPLERDGCLLTITVPLGAGAVPPRQVADATVRGDRSH